MTASHPATGAGRPTAFIFSGLGSQYYQMGRALFDQLEPFRNCMQRLDRRAVAVLQRSTLDAVYAPSRTPRDAFDDLLGSSLALYALEVALAETFCESGLRPDLVVGVSMGTFAAATVAGQLNCDDALRALQQQAEAVKRYCPPGGMLAVLGPLALFDDERLQVKCELASVNGPAHFVLAADVDGLSVAEHYLRRTDIPFQRLPVRYAFHSRWIDRARPSLQRLLPPGTAGAGSVPMLCAATVAEMSTIAADYFWTVARQPIRLCETIGSLERRGSWLYVDIRPSGSVAAVASRALSEGSRSTVKATITPFRSDLDAFHSVLAEANRPLHGRDRAWPS